MALIESESKYRSLFENMINGFAYCKILLDENNQPIDFVYLEVNDCFEKLTGLRKEDIVGEKVTVAIPAIKDTHPELFDIYGKVALTGEETVFDIYFEPLEIWLSISAYSPQKGYFVAIIENITDRKRAEETLQQSEQKYRNLFKSSIDPVYISTQEDSFADVNQSFLELFGYTIGEMQDLKVQAIYVNPDDRLIFRQDIERREYVKDYKLKLRKKDGTNIICLVSASVRKKSDGTILGCQGVIRDITEKKRAEEELLRHQKQLRYLPSQLIEAQEKERKRISLELHDEMGQALTAIGISLKEVEEELPSDLDPTTGEKLADIHSIVDKASEQIGNLSLDLRPSMLDDLGLVPTLRWFIYKTAKRTKLEVKFETTDIGKKLDSGIETILYRVSQEALNNIIKHADAKHVIVRLELKQESIALYIKDDGKGFDVEKALMDQLEGRIGLLGMQERASIAGGNLSIQSRKGHGTVILAEIPLH